MHWQHAKIIEVKLRELNQLFNSLDPSPFRDKDLDRDAEEFIVASAMEAERWQPLVLVIHLEKPPADDVLASQQVVTDAVHHFFQFEANQQRRKLRELMKLGRRSLFIGVLFLAACVGASRVIGSLGSQPIFAIAQESLFIVGWVAMWRPLEIFLYDWWPIVRLRRLYARMSAMEVQIRHDPTTTSSGSS